MHPVDSKVSVCVNFGVQCLRDVGVLHIPNIHRRTKSRKCTERNKLFALGWTNVHAVSGPADPYFLVDDL
jgi:hypothetical protein